MQKITEKIAALPKDGNYFSLEFFPPKTQMVRSLDQYAVQFTDDVFAGLFEPSTPTGTHGPRSQTLVCGSDLGRWG